MDGRALLAQRRRLEGQLHDGTQACLYEARSQVRRARREVSNPAAAASIETATAILGDAIAELRTLVRGIYPAGLRETGLGSALFTATSDFPLVVEIADDADNSLDEVTATAGFFTVMDVLRIAVRSRARTATVRIFPPIETAPVFGSSTRLRRRPAARPLRKQPLGQTKPAHGWLPKTASTRWTERCRSPERAPL